MHPRGSASRRLCGTTAGGKTGFYAKRPPTFLLIHFIGTILKTSNYYSIVSETLASCHREEGFPDGTAGRETRALRRLRKDSRSSRISRPHVLQRIRISAPIRRTVHRLDPHGWGFRVSMISPICISSCMSDNPSGYHFRQRQLICCADSPARVPSGSEYS